MMKKTVNSEFHYEIKHRQCFLLPAYDFRGCSGSLFILRPLEPLMQLIPVAELVLQLISNIGVIEVNGSILLSILKVLDNSV